MRNTLADLQEEARSYAYSRQKCISRYSIEKSKESIFVPETLETDVKGSFASKNNDYTSLISSLQLNVKQLQEKINCSERKVKENDKDNQKLKDVIKNLEGKIEKFQMFEDNHKGYSCSNNCGIF